MLSDRSPSLYSLQLCVAAISALGIHFLLQQKHQYANQKTTAWQPLDAARSCHNSTPAQLFSAHSRRASPLVCRHGLQKAGSKMCPDAVFEMKPITRIMSRCLRFASRSFSAEQCCSHSKQSQARVARLSAVVASSPQRQRQRRL